MKLLWMPDEFVEDENLCFQTIARDALQTSLYQLEIFAEGKREVAREVNTKEKFLKLRNELFEEFELIRKRLDDVALVLRSNETVPRSGETEVKFSFQTNDEQGVAADVD